SLKSNSENVDALQVLYILSRLKNDQKMLDEVRQKLEKLNPLNHFLSFEDYFQSPSDENKNKFTDLIQNEMPVETFLELAIWYANLGFYDEGREVLELAPQNTETLYWLAWLHRDGNASLSKEYLSKASASSPGYVFPFREETAKVLEWAADKDASWHSDYLLALIEDYRGNREDAMERMISYDEAIPFAPFYLLRARLFDQSSLALKLQDVDKAISIDQDEWRYG